ncbi:hypothetical protein CEXT_391311 [Caerostris extrusa]|uniref:Uncharacterized protein n=1 Tax=Caerostris extrusa TaxID=172846 RepID=A0AAV4NVU6_CAEEX|nr:hypothetical protein CEXT_391311 [Caerostris extrusa]
METDCRSLTRRKCSEKGDRLHNADAKEVCSKRSQMADSERSRQTPEKEQGCSEKRLKGVVINETRRVLKKEKRKCSVKLDRTQRRRKCSVKLDRIQRRRKCSVKLDRIQRRSKCAVKRERFRKVKRDRLGDRETHRKCALKKIQISEDNHIQSEQWKETECRRKTHIKRAVEG